MGRNLSAVTTGERLLDLVVEYQASKEARAAQWEGAGQPVGREPAEIAADYEAALRGLFG